MGVVILFAAGVALGGCDCLVGRTDIGGTITSVGDCAPITVRVWLCADQSQDDCVGGYGVAFSDNGVGAYQVTNTPGPGGENDCTSRSTLVITGEKCQTQFPKRAPDDIGAPVDVQMACACASN